MSVHFDAGEANYLNRTSGTGTSGIADTTVACRFNQDAGVAENQILVQWRFDPTAPPYEGGTIRINNTGPTLIYREGKGNVTEVDVSSTSFSRGAWVTVVARLTGTSMELFINGVSVATGTFDPSGRATSDSGFVIGAGDDYSGGPGAGIELAFLGDIADVVFDDVSWTQPEITAWHSRWVVPSGVKARWYLAVNTDTADVSGNGNTLTSNGTLTTGAAVPLLLGAAAGQSVSGGSSNPLSMPLALVAAGQTLSGGAANPLSMPMALVAAGLTRSGGASNPLSMPLSLVAAGQTISGGTANLTGPGVVPGSSGAPTRGPGRGRLATGRRMIGRRAG